MARTREIARPWRQQPQGAVQLALDGRALNVAESRFDGAATRGVGPTGQWARASSGRLTVPLTYAPVANDFALTVAFEDGRIADGYAPLVGLLKSAAAQSYSVHLKNWDAVGKLMVYDSSGGAIISLHLPDPLGNTGPATCVVNSRGGQSELWWSGRRLWAGTPAWDVALGADPALFVGSANSTSLVALTRSVADPCTVSLNPWQLFDPQRIRIPTAAAGGAVPDITFVGAESILTNSAGYRVSLNYA